MFFLQGLSLSAEMTLTPVSYTHLDVYKRQVHDIEYYARIARDLQDMGADSLCLKDMAGILGPKDAYEIVKRWKDETGLPVEVHSHYTSGMASMAYLKAIEAGADAINCAISSLSMSTSQPAGDTFVAALKDTQYDTGLDLALMSEIAEHFKGCLLYTSRCV